MNPWNGTSGCAWVDLQETLDGMFAPFEDLLVEAVTAHAASHVLDVGCGTGSTTIAAARMLGAAGRAVGIDISEPMISVARERAVRAGAAASFACADAQDHAFSPASFDFIISRFGVMFFDDPPRAFANLRRACSDGAGLFCIAWRSPGENPFMTAAERAVGSMLPGLPAREPNVPGQFGFADETRVRRILEEGGWRDIGIRPLDAECKLPHRELERYMTRLGPVGSRMADLDEPVRARIVGKMRAAFDAYVHGTEVRYTAACWVITARA